MCGRNIHSANRRLESPAHAILWTQDDEKSLIKSISKDNQVKVVKYLPGSWPCMNMAAFHKDYFYHFSISLFPHCLLNQIVQFWLILGNFERFFDLNKTDNMLFNSKTTIFGFKMGISRCSNEARIISRPVNLGHFRVKIEKKRKIGCFVEH